MYHQKIYRLIFTIERTNVIGIYHSVTSSVKPPFASFKLRHLRRLISSLARLPLLAQTTAAHARARRSSGSAKLFLSSNTAPTVSLPSRPPPPAHADRRTSRRSSGGRRRGSAAVVLQHTRLRPPRPQSQLVAVMAVMMPRPLTTMTSGKSIMYFHYRNRPLCREPDPLGTGLYALGATGINSCSQLLSHVNADELGCLFKVDFASFLAHVRGSAPQEQGRRLREGTDQAGARH
jgi:hypothetical protein